MLNSFHVSRVYFTLNYSTSTHRCSFKRMQTTLDLVVFTMLSKGIRLSPPFSILSVNRENGLPYHSLMFHNSMIISINQLIRFPFPSYAII